MTALFCSWKNMKISSSLLMKFCIHFFLILSFFALKKNAGSESKNSRSVYYVLYLSLMLKIWDPDPDKKCGSESGKNII